MPHRRRHAFWVVEVEGSPVEVKLLHVAVVYQSELEVVHPEEAARLRCVSPVVLEVEELSAVHGEFHRLCVVNVSLHRRGDERRACAVELNGVPVVCVEPHRVVCTRRDARGEGDGVVGGLVELHHVTGDRRGAAPVAWIGHIARSTLPALRRSSRKEAECRREHQKRKTAKRKLIV